MKIDATTNSGPIGTPVGQVTTPARVNATDNPTNFQQTDVLNGAMADVPNVRPEAVARAQQLIHDSSYPSPQVIHDVSRLFVAALQDE
jgi:hypothetical protein